MDLSSKRKIITTNDGSHSLLVPELNEQYHSVHGAKQEAEHVFLKMGLDPFEKKEISVFEVGFGTGLNTLLTFDYADKNHKIIDYTSIEKYPVTKEEYAVLNYGTLIDRAELLIEIHELSWGVKHVLSDSFSLHKINGDLIEDALPSGFDVIFFDAFAPNKQPHLWSVDVFKKMFLILNDNGLLVTYCAQGAARRAMIAAGFQVEKVPGPPGKREMLRAWKK